MISLLFTSLLTHLPTPNSTVLLEKLADSQLVKNFPTFYWSRMFIPTFTHARHLSLTWVISIQDMPLHPTSLKSILITLSHLHLDLVSGTFPTFFPTRTPVYISPVILYATCPAKCILLDLITRNLWLKNTVH